VERNKKLQSTMKFRRVFSNRDFWPGISLSRVGFTTSSDFVAREHPAKPNIYDRIVSKASTINAFSISESWYWIQLSAETTTFK